MGAFELIAVSLLHSVAHCGWHPSLNEAISNTFMSTCSWSEKLSLLSKALNAYKPDMSGMEAILSGGQLFDLVKKLKDVSLSVPETNHLQHSAREILLITQGVTRVPANCSGLMEEGIEDALQCLMDKNDEQMNGIVAGISWQIATASQCEIADNMNHARTEMDFAVTAVGEYMLECLC